MPPRPPPRPSEARRWCGIAYVVGVLAACYHLANGLWTMGITWGVWTSPNAQSWANVPVRSASGSALVADGTCVRCGACHVDDRSRRRKRVDGETDRS